MNQIIKNDIELKKVNSINTPIGAKSDTKTTENIQKAEKTVESILNPTAEERISKLKTLNKVSEKYEKLRIKQEAFDIFRATQDRTGQSIVLENSNGYHFEVSNIETFKKVIDVISSDLEKLVIESKNEVLNFQL